METILGILVLIILGIIAVIMSEKSEDYPRAEKVKIRSVVIDGDKNKLGKETFVVDYHTYKKAKEELEKPD